MICRGVVGFTVDSYDQCIVGADDRSFDEWSSFLVLCMLNIKMWVRFGWWLPGDRAYLMLSSLRGRVGGLPSQAIFDTLDAGV